jgi:hypothetical protein
MLAMLTQTITLLTQTITFVSIHPTRTVAAILPISPGNAINPDMLDPI